MEHNKPKLPAWIIILILVLLGLILLGGCLCGGFWALDAFIGRQ